jgi:hypothetical protein
MSKGESSARWVDCRIKKTGVYVKRDAQRIAKAMNCKSWAPVTISEYKCTYMYIYIRSVKNTTNVFFINYCIFYITVYNKLHVSASIGHLQVVGNLKIRHIKRGGGQDLTLQ